MRADVPRHYTLNPKLKPTQPQTLNPLKPCKCWRSRRSNPQPSLLTLKAQPLNPQPEPSAVLAHEMFKTVEQRRQAAIAAQAVVKPGAKGAWAKVQTSKVLASSNRFDAGTASLKP
jgi:hypothetical protein